MRDGRRRTTKAPDSSRTGLARLEPEEFQVTGRRSEDGARWVGPPAFLEWVYMSEGGRCFHSRVDCPSLVRGVEQVGIKRNHCSDIERLELEAAVGRGAVACIHCFPSPDFRPRKGKTGRGTRRTLSTEQIGSTEAGGRGARRTCRQCGMRMRVHLVTNGICVDCQ